MERKIVEYNDNLELYVKQVSDIFDVSRIIDAPQERSQIINYYLMNKLTYRLGYNWEGFLHFGISYDGKYKKEDCKEHARIVERYIQATDAKNVLELGYGWGLNSAFLARRNPHVTFEAIDLSNKPLRRFAKIPNVRFHTGDYHDLSMFEDNSFDIAFVLEALCYSTNKVHVLREVKKKLRKDGLFIVIEGYQKDCAIPLSQSEDIAWKLISKGMAVEKIECLTDVENYMQQEYSIAEAEDLSQCILPSLDRQESRVRHYFRHPYYARAVNKLLPLDIVKNFAVVLLLATIVRRQVACYYLHVLRNDQ